MRVAGDFIRLIPREMGLHRPDNPHGWEPRYRALAETIEHAWKWHQSR